MTGMSAIDVAVIAAYLIGITVFGIVVGYRRRTTSQEYFLAGKSLGWFTVGAAIFTSNISTIHLVGLAAGGESGVRAVLELIHEELVTSMALCGVDRIAAVDEQVLQAANEGRAR